MLDVTCCPPKFAGAEHLGVNTPSHPDFMSNVLNKAFIHFFCHKLNVLTEIGTAKFSSVIKAAAHKHTHTACNRITRKEYSQN